MGSIDHQILDKGSVLTFFPCFLRYFKLSDKMFRTLLDKRCKLRSIEHIIFIGFSDLWCSFNSNNITFLDKGSFPTGIFILAYLIVCIHNLIKVLNHVMIDFWVVAALFQSSFDHKIAILFDDNVQFPLSEYLQSAGVLIGPNNVNKLEVAAEYLINFLKLEFHFHQLLTWNGWLVDLKYSISGSSDASNFGFLFWSYLFAARRRVVIIFDVLENFDKNRLNLRVFVEEGIPIVGILY